MTIPVIDESHVLAILRRNVSEIMLSVDTDVISGQGRLADYGCNSLDRSDIVWKTMIDLEIDVPLDRFAEIEDIAGLTRLFVEYARLGLGAS